MCYIKLHHTEKITLNEHQTMDDYEEANFIRIMSHYELN